MGLVLLHVSLFVLLASSACYFIWREHRSSREILLKTHEASKAQLEAERDILSNYYAESKRKLALDKDKVEHELLVKINEAKTAAKLLQEAAVAENAKQVEDAHKVIQGKIDETHSEYDLLERYFRESMASDATLTLITCAYAVASKNLPPRGTVDSDLTYAVMRHRQEAGPTTPRKLINLFGDKKIHGTYN